MYKVLVSDPIADKGIAILEDAGFEVIYNPNPSNEELESYSRDINAWVVRSGTKILAEYLKDARNLQVIGRAGVGVDNIDINEATKQGVIVMNMPDGNIISAAEHTIAMMMSLSRNIQLGHAGILAGEWNRSNLMGSELHGKTLGVVGLGRVGREVIKRSIGLEMKILGHDPFVSSDIIDEEKVKIVDLDELTEKSDYITLHVPFLETTNNLFDAKRISMMKDSARIINVARGGIVNESDLAHALNEGIIAGAAIDVFDTEPLEKNHPLISTKNILLTPHLGASTLEASEGVSSGICRQVRDYLLDGKLSNPLNMPIQDMVKLKQILPLLNLSKILGKICSQLAESPIESVSIECMGDIEDSKPIALSFLIGLIQDMTDSKINFVNAGVVAQERGITFSHSFSSESTSFSNLINIVLITKEDEITLGGSVFGEHNCRIVNIFGYELDFRPEGNMLFLQNKDVPGVIGKVGVILSDANVNIGEFILSRTTSKEIAYSVIKVDEKIDSALLNQLIKVDEIVSIKQLSV